MVEGGGSPAFPVVFFDGEREMNIGDVNISPTLEYKPFLFMLSQKIGISPNQISIYLVERRKNLTEDRKRIPVTGKINFGLICRQKDCCFLVVLKRSRKSKTLKERTMNGVEFADYLPGNNFHPTPMHSVPENLVLLRRNQDVPFCDQITQSELANLNDRLQNLRVMRENYEMSMVKGNLNSLNFSSDYGLDLHSIPKVDDWNRVPSTTMMMTNNETQKAFCEECANAEKNVSTTSFHPCVNDEVVTRFSTRFGPITRPNKPFR